MAGIPLSLHKPLKDGIAKGQDAPAIIDADIDQDSSVSPKPWVVLTLVDEDNDATSIRLNAQEALQLAKRLNDLGSAVL